jgi:hypothetical protein
MVSDVMAYNYADPQIEAFHTANPKIPVMGTENVSAVATRGIYKIDAEKAFVSSYDPYTTAGRTSPEGKWRLSATCGHRLNTLRTAGNLGCSTASPRPTRFVMLEFAAFCGK